MLLLYVTVSCVLLGSSAAFMMMECYGGSVLLPFYYASAYFTGQLYFTPNGGNKKLVMDNRKAKDPRLKITDYSVEYTDLTESGVFSVSGEGYDMTLIVEDCADEVSKSYGEIFTCDVPGQAEFLEFTTRGSEGRPQVLWKRTDPQTSRGGRGQVRRNVWEMKRLTDKDSGHYNFRAKDNRLLSRKLLQVEVPSLNYHETENVLLFIPYPLGSTLWSVNFNGEPLVKDGDLVTEDHEDSETLVGRTRVRPDGILIDPVKITDSGLFTFRDPEGSVAQRVTLDVEPGNSLQAWRHPQAYSREGAVAQLNTQTSRGDRGQVRRNVWEMKRLTDKDSGHYNFRAKDNRLLSRKLFQVEEPTSTSASPIFVFLGIAFPIILVIFVCCCCMGKCGRPASNSAGRLPVHHHPPINSLASSQPAAASIQPPAYRPVNIHVRPHQPEVSPGPPLAAQRAAPALSLGSDCLSSYPEPQFVLKGLSSAQPLGSDVTFSHVYTSDKLNFL